MQSICRTVLLGAWVLTAACDGPDRVTAAPAPASRPSLDLTAGVSPPPTYVGYSLTDVSGGVWSQATDVNDDGVVVGFHLTPNGQHGFVRHESGVVEDVPPLPGDVSSVVTGIDNADEIVGTSTAHDGTTHAWVRGPAQAMTRLHDDDCEGSAHANAIAADGEIAGECRGAPAIWSGAHPHERALIVGSFGELFDIKGGIAVGTITSFDSPVFAFVWRPNALTPRIRTPDGTTRAWASAIDASSQVVGGYTLDGVDHGFRASFPSSGPGVTVTLLAHAVSGISPQGRLVGTYGAVHPNAYTLAPNAWTELELPPTALDRAAVKVNRCGAIVGYYYPSGQQYGPRAALWTKPYCD